LLQVSNLTNGVISGRLPQGNVLIGKDTSFAQLLYCRPVVIGKGYEIGRMFAFPVTSIGDIVTIASFSEIKTALLKGRLY
jgi:hypothetical protein